MAASRFKDVVHGGTRVAETAPALQSIAETIRHNEVALRDAADNHALHIGAAPRTFRPPPMDSRLSYNFDEIESSVRQELHTASARFNAALQELKANVAPLQGCGLGKLPPPTASSS